MNFQILTGSKKVKDFEKEVQDFRLNNDSATETLISFAKELFS